jgi:hypothetical protein
MEAGACAFTGTHPHFGHLGLQAGMRSFVPRDRVGAGRNQFHQPLLLARVLALLLL